MWVASLGSGSRGNATLVRTESTCLLIDNGFSLSQFQQRCNRLELDIEAISAILVTHEHSDHGSGVIKLARYLGIPVWATVGTACSIGLTGYRAINGGMVFDIGDIRIEAVTVPHDAAEPVQFIFTDERNRRFGVLTDCGHISAHMRDVYSHLDTLMLEFNYDPNMLEQGPYPYTLKQRVGGQHGHLSNLQAIDLFDQVKAGLQCLIAGHISQKNNSPRCVSELIQTRMPDSEVVLASQETGFDWIKV